jgi:hypothetical protein
MKFFMRAAFQVCTQSALVQASASLQVTTLYCSLVYSFHFAVIERLPQMRMSMHVIRFAL